MRACWRRDPQQRPEMSEVARSLAQLERSLAMPLSLPRGFTLGFRSAQAHNPTIAAVSAGKGGGKAAGAANSDGCVCLQNEEYHEKKSNVEFPGMKSTFWQWVQQWRR